MTTDQMRTSILAVFVLLPAALPADAQTPLGSEFRVDTNGAGLIHPIMNRHSVAVAPDGRLVITWVGSDSSFSPDVRARLFNAAGKAVGPEFTVNTFTTGWQASDAVAIDGAGNFVVVWGGDVPGGSSYGVFGQRFDSVGSRIGSEFRINSTFTQRQPAVAMRAGGDFVVVWSRIYFSSSQIFGLRYDSSGAPIGVEFQVDAATTEFHLLPDVDVDALGNFVVVWNGAYFGSGQRFDSNGVRQGNEFTIFPILGRVRASRSASGPFVVAWSGQGAGDSRGVFARRFDAAGMPVGGDFLVNQFTTGGQNYADVDMDLDGDFVITWNSFVGSSVEVSGRRFDPAGIGGSEFRVNTYTTVGHFYANVGADPAGNFVVTWRTPDTAAGVFQVLARRFAAGLVPNSLAVDALASATSDGNGVFEAGETVTVAPSWLNANFAAENFTGTASSFTGAGSSTYAIADGAASYGTVASNATGSCATAADCYAMGVTLLGSRPALHWDASFHEEISPANLGAAKTWTLHVGDSFTDVPRASGFYRFVETLLHHSVTGGCTATQYCPLLSTTRDQMAVFVLVAKEGAGYVPPACTTPMFGDVPASNPFCPWIEELARRNVVAGCGGGNYCPASPVTRDEMAVFVLLTKEPGLVPPACGTPMFNDVPASSGFCRWIEELARRAVVTGCGGGNYCPAAPVTREQMAVFVSGTFGLMLYGP